MGIVENKIIDARLTGLSFSQLDDKELLLATDQIILRCSAIYGCEMPYTEIFANVLSDEIIKFITGFGYKELTLAEVNLAMEVNLPTMFRISDSLDLDEIVFTGRCVNVCFLGKILKNYKSIRNFLDRKIQNQIDGHQ